jgi:hypothetical protein
MQMKCAESGVSAPAAQDQDHHEHGQDQRDQQQSGVCEVV